LLEEGRIAIKVLTRTAARHPGHSGTGEAFGRWLLAVVDPVATALALEPVKTLTIHQDTFTSLRAEHPHIEGMLVAVLASRVDRLSRHLVEALYESVQTR